MSTRIFAGGLAIAAIAGLVFASVSTLDFVQHLDRQVHDLHCSFAPGLVEADQESKGCQVTLLSPYSSVMRTSLWGGIPISLGAMAVFAFLLFRAIEVLTAPAQRLKTAASIALATTMIPVLASAVMGTIAFTELHAACKLCIGIYISSGVALLMAGLGWVMARKAALGLEFADEPQGDEPAPRPRAALAWSSAAAQAFGFVTVPVVAYAMVVPDYSEYIGTCGALVEPDDPYGVMVPMGGATGGVPTIEVFDPLCPACRGFEERLHASGLDARLQRTALMFPLDSECNWMVTRSLHPGACRVSEAVLCGADDAAVGVDAVVSWAFEHQETLTEAGKRDPESVTTEILGRFPSLGECLGSAEVKSRINKSLRWTVSNELPVMTPQLYVAGVKLCDEDSDLGLDFTLHRMLERHAAGSLKSDAPAAQAPAAGLVPGSEAAPTKDGATKRRTKPRSGSNKASKATKSKPKAAKPEEPKPEEPKPEEPKPDPGNTLPGVEELPPPADDDAKEDSP